ncbi:MAG: ABC transporter permease [Ruminococcus sp.]|jgi:peptide/nickel transport system permease protein|nr:ABC transporter permease [Bacillota bacterium]
MLKYVGKRLIYMVGVFFVVSIIMFGLFNNVPGDRALNQIQAMKGKVSNEQFEIMYEQQREKLGLDDPIPVRYVKWMGNLLQGNLGYSTFYKKDVADVIGEPLRNTIFINIFATILALGITIPLGIWCAVKKFSKFDNAVQVLTIVGYSVPVYIIALVFMYIFSVKLGIFPLSGMNSPNFQGSGLAFFLDRMYYLALPLIVMTIAALGSMTRYVRAAMIDALSMDYIRTARAKGLREKVVIYSHAWRNALLSVVTLIIGWFMSVFMGSIIIEQMFQLNGIGQMYYKGLMNQDYDLALAIQMLYCVITLISNLITDLSYGIVDPRVRVNK